MSTPQGQKWAPSRFIKPFFANQDLFPANFTVPTNSQGTQTDEASPVAAAWKRRKKRKRKEWSEEDEAWTALPFHPRETDSEEEAVGF